MSGSHNPGVQTAAGDPASAVLDELRCLAEKMGPEFSYFSAYMDMFRIDLATVVHALARVGAIDDARRTIERVKGSSRRAPLHALALALAERGEADAARKTALELPGKGAFSAPSTLIELVDIQARRGDFAGAVQAAEQLEDIEQSARTLANIAQLQAEAEVGNFANARTVPEPHTNHSWVGMADLFARAGDRHPDGAALQTLRRAVERATAIPKSGAKSTVLAQLAHHLVWYGDTQGAIQVARAAGNQVGQEKALVRVVEGLAGRGDTTAAEQLAADLRSEQVRQDAMARLANARAGVIARETVPVESWTEVLQEAEQLRQPDERLNRIARFVAFHPLPADARQTIGTALLRVRQALTEGGAAIKAAGLARDAQKAALTSEVKWRVKMPEAKKDIEASRAARLCRIAGAQGTLGDLAGGAETARLLADSDFRACALALALSGSLEFQVRQHHARND